MKTQYLIGAVVGISILVAVVSVYLLINQNSRINQLENFSAQVATIINNASKAPTK